MKKLTRKLVLSAFALALALVTLSTTTFAWWTQNTSVSADGVTGNTKGDASGSLEISKTSTSGFGPTVTLGVSLADLSPLQHIVTDGTAALAELGSTESTDKGGYAQFTVYVRTSSKLTEDTEVYLKNLVITNTTADADDTEDGTQLPSKQVLAQAGGLTGAIGSTYTVDAVRALSFAISTSGIGTTEYSYGEIYTPVTDTIGNNAASFDALEYYNAVMGNTAGIDNSSEEINLAEKTNILVATIEKSNAAAETPSDAVAITFTFWLDGWDKCCFDACQNQTFSIEFELTTNKDLIDFIPNN